MINLSEAQKKIVDSPFDRAIQVLASAGSGKTRVLTERARHILKSTKKEGVIALTFTNKAAEELLSRLDGESGLEKRAWITTVHAVAKRILEQYGHAIGLPSELHVYERDHDRKTVFLQSLHDNGLDVDSFLNVADPKTRKNRQRTIQNYMERFSVIKRELLSESEIKDRFSKNPNFEADQILINKEKVKQEYAQYLLNHEANDKNPKNYIQVKQKSNFFLAENKYQPQTPLTRQELPLYSLVQARVPKILIEGVRRKVPSKLKKLIPPMKSIIGHHYYDALALMGSKNRKSMKYITKTLIQVKNHAINRGFDETRLYVVAALTGKHKRSLGVRFHGKGRGGRIKHDLCQLRIKLEEKSYEDLYKIMYAGKTPPMLAYALRQKLLENNAGYEEIKKYSWVLTEKGRQQHKLMLKRRVFLTYFHNLVLGSYF